MAIGDGTIKSDLTSSLGAAASGAATGAATGASLGAAGGTAVLPVVGTGIGAGAGAAIGALVGAITIGGAAFATNRAARKKMEDLEEESSAALDKAEKEAAELASRQARKEQADATRASAQGKILGGATDDILFQAASTGANLEGFKRRNFPTYG